MIDTNQKKGNYYIIADHLRTTIFALADGARFESKGRGYVLKKLIKKTTLLAHFLNIDAQQLIKISRKLIEINSSYHTHLKEEDKSIISELEREINKYRQFISSSIQELDKNYSPKITAENIFF